MPAAKASLLLVEFLRWGLPRGAVRKQSLSLHSVVDGRKPNLEIIIIISFDAGSPDSVNALVASRGRCCNNNAVVSDSLLS